MGASVCAARSRRDLGWRRGLLAVGFVTGTVVASVGAPPISSASATPGHAATAPSPEFESQFVGRVNSLRASKGLSQLQVSGELVGVARNWTERMVANGDISHNPNLGSQVSGNWTKLGENVGVGYDVDGLMQAFINSSSHYKNLVDPEWNYLGVGVVVTPDGRMWTTHNFMAKPAAPPPPAPAPAPAAKPKPAGGSTVPTAVAPPTTVPPPPGPKPTAERIAAVLAPLRSLESD